MFYIVESSKSFYEVGLDLPPVIQRLGFVVLGQQDIGETLRRKDIDVDDECQVFQVGNYRLIEALLARDIRLGLGMPWQIAVFTRQGATQLGLLRPAFLGQALPPDAERDRLLAEIEAKLVHIVDEAR